MKFNYKYIENQELFQLLNISKVIGNSKFLRAEFSFRKNHIINSMSMPNDIYHKNTKNNNSESFMPLFKLKTQIKSNLATVISKRKAISAQFFNFS